MLSPRGDGSLQAARPADWPCRLWRQRARRLIREQAKSGSVDQGTDPGGGGSLIWGTRSQWMVGEGVGLTPRSLAWAMVRV